MVHSTHFYRTGLRRRRKQDVYTYLVPVLELVLAFVMVPLIITFVNLLPSLGR